MVDEPRASIWGGVVAAPAFKEIARFNLQHLEIPPDAPSQRKRPAADRSSLLGGLDALIGRCTGEVIGRGRSRSLTSRTTRARPRGASFTSRATPTGTTAWGRQASGCAVERSSMSRPQVDSGRAAWGSPRTFEEPTTSSRWPGHGRTAKTTTVFLLQPCSLGGSLPDSWARSWIVGGEQRPALFTTPEAVDLQRLLREMVDAGDRSAAIEASSHGSELRRLDRVRFDALVFTNLGQDHLDLHGTMEDYFQAKRRLFAGAQPPPAAVNW
jgi:hypothetical protein